MRYFTNFLVLILLVSGAPSAISQAKAARADQLQPASIRINRDVLAEDRPLREIFLDVLRGTGVNGGFAEIAG